MGGSPSPATPFVKAEGQVLVEKGDDYLAQQSFITHTDNPGNHFSHDINAFLVPDPGYRHLLSNGSFEEGIGNEHAKMEIEWERGGMPTWAFPSQGDRLAVWGPHIWDCGHGDTWLGGDNTYRTEIHPPVGWVVFRQTADADALPGTEEKRTRTPWQWYAPDDLQGSAGTLPTTGLGSTPVGRHGRGRLLQQLGRRHPGGAERVRHRRHRHRLRAGQRVAPGPAAAGLHVLRPGPRQARRRRAGR